MSEETIEGRSAPAGGARKWGSHTEARGVESGLEWIVLGLDMGHRCGYVRVPEDHPWFGLDYVDAADGRTMPRDERGRADFFTDDGIEWDDRIESQLRVHGGVTYAGKRPGEDCKEGWWFGFDCAHSGDGKDPELLSDGYERLAEFGGFYGEVRSAVYVQGECETLARQLAEAGSATPEDESPPSIKGSSHE